MATQLVTVNVPTTDFTRALPFYAALLGIDTDSFIYNYDASVVQYYTSLTADGVDLTITDKQDTRETTVTYYAVDDLASMVSALEDLGGGLAVPQTDMPEDDTSRTPEEKRAAQPREGDPKESSDFGSFAMMVDPDGNYIALVQLGPSASEHFNVSDDHEKRLQARREEVLRSAR